MLTSEARTPFSSIFLWICCTTGCPTSSTASPQHIETMELAHNCVPPAAVFALQRRHSVVQSQSSHQPAAVTSGRLLSLFVVVVVVVIRPLAKCFEWSFARSFPTSTSKFCARRTVKFRRMYFCCQFLTELVVSVYLYTRMSLRALVEIILKQQKTSEN